MLVIFLGSGRRRHDAVGRPRTARPVTQPVARHHHLADDLAGGEVAHQTLRAGVAERAIERAADLARHAQGAAVGVGDVDALDLVRQAALGIARQAQQPFARAVDRNLLGDDFGTVEREALGQSRAQFLRNAAHGVERGDATKIDPVPELLHAHLALRLRHADRAESGGKPSPREADQRRLGRRHVARKRRLFDNRRGCGDGHPSSASIIVAIIGRESPYLHSAATLSSASPRPLSE